ncbi:MAG: ABC transporter ATP-binding protein [Actinomycetota bacterium]|nr:ABC transporter ATP-binding protein [Actinomycetota bacterium]
MSALLEARGLHLGYGKSAVVRGVDFEVHSGEVVALLGPNGAGKTTTMLGLSGELRPMAGEVHWKGSATRTLPHQRAKAGLGVITEERSVFMGLTVAENLRLGGVGEEVFRLFPELDRLRNRRVGLLSGGEQQILAVGRALARSPQVLIADELSFGLAPLVVRRLLRAIRVAADGGVGVLLVEQHVRQVLEIADHVVVMRQGEVAFNGTADEARADLGSIEASYLSSRPLD